MIDNVIVAITTPGKAGSAGSVLVADAWQWPRVLRPLSGKKVQASRVRYLYTGTPLIRLAERSWIRLHMCVWKRPIHIPGKIPWKSMVTAGH